MGSKVSDEWTIPLCVTHHRALHDVGSEEAWWAERGIDVKAEAKRLWREGQASASIDTAARSGARRSDARCSEIRSDLGLIDALVLGHVEVEPRARLGTPPPGLARNEVVSETGEKHAVAIVRRCNQTRAAHARKGGCLSGPPASA
jgi:hypothetical protein